MKCRKLLILALAIIASGATASAMGGYNEKPYIEVRASATKQIAHNALEISINLSEEQSKGRITIKELRENLARALRTVGVDATESLVLVSQSSAAVKRQDSYHYARYMLTLDDSQQMDELFVELKRLGISDVKLERVYNSNAEQLMSELRAEAMRSAAQMARELAEAVNQRIGAALQINYYSTGNEVSEYVASPMLRSADNQMLAASAPQLPSNIEIKPIKVSQNVTVRFELLAN